MGPSPAHSVYLHLFPLLYSFMFCFGGGGGDEGDDEGSGDGDGGDAGGCGGDDGSGDGDAGDGGGCGAGGSGRGVYMHMCLLCVTEHAETRAVCLPVYCLIPLIWSLPWNQKLTLLVKLLCLPAPKHKLIPNFTWVLGIQTQDLVLAFQNFLPSGSFP